ncbi:hypothetical protein MPSEU_000176100 [Mayamaea pseudoterrestris]|nr:hypothetical protein MPSEU_000176100 [Mayamaea pseudoterrestris]
MYRSKHLNVFFQLSKLRMRFNKEARHRRLFIAEMDSTTVTYSTTSANGWSSHVSVGNLAFADADSLRDLTLYREILGLKSDSGQSSLLRLDILKYPRSRRYVSQGDDPNVASLGCGVVIDTKQKKLHGCDISLEAHFSPMRFVFLEQLWFEIIDYFFEGIMGAEVWGTKKVIAEPSAALDAPNADLFSFTKFNIVMESPLIVFPVSYCSPDYLRVEASSIVFANSYSCSEMRIRDSSSNHSSCRWQWFNNCKIMLSSIRLVSSSGIDLLRFGDAFAGEVSLNWPSGPTAALNCPKWKVACAIDAVHMTLDQDEFVLLQHIVQFNICEESRHLDEWRALQHLPLELREQYKASIMVHFGYDKKDVTPTTYELNVDVPSLSFGFRQGVAIADVRCEDISWTMWKAMDLVNRQRVECNVEILSVEKEGRVPLLMSSSLDRSPCPTATKDLVYESESDPFAENSKCLTIAYSRIYLIYSSWSRFSGFFKGLSGPKSVAPGEVIQIGDRWYNIKATDEESSARVDRDQLSWISAFKASSASAMEDSKANNTMSSTFRLSLIQPSILVGTEEYGLVLKADKVNFYHNARLPQIERRFDLSGLQLQTQSSMVPSLDTTGSLIEPWHSHGIWRSCNCTVACACDSHIAQVEAGTLEARASFTDMTVAIEVLLRFVVDMRQTEHRHYKSGHEPHIDTSSENAAPISFGPPKQSYTANWKGFKLVIIDDSGRHFATSQELAAFSLSEVAFQRTALLSLEHGVLYIMRLTLGSVDVADCLQSVTSPFRNVLAIRRIDDNVKLSSSEDKEYVGHAAVEVSSQLGACRDYHVKVSACELQYNPSLVIALQRFIGRLHKDFKFRVDAILTNHAEASFVFQRSSDPDAVAGKDVHINGTIEAETLILRLNKEHQGRQLIVTTVKDMTVRSSKSRSGMCIKGHLGSIYTVENDKIDDFGQTLLRATGSQKFLQFSFRKFATRRLAAFPGSDEKLPDWVIGRLLDEPELDDCLEVNISALELTFLRDRAEELIDYMTNGMPGRGMGATGRAAQHFVKERIQKKSFLQISLEAPTILIPVGYATASGLSCRLGDFTIKSWIDSRSLARKLAVVVCGLSLMRYKTVPNTDQTTIKSTIVSEIDFAVELEKSRVLLLSQIEISEVHVPLRYTDYVLLMAVFEGNVGRKTDKLAWNNLEAAWDKLASQGQAGGGEQEAFSNDLVYSSSARLIRYGKNEDEAAHKLKPIEVNIQVQCDRLSLVLHRDDCSVTLIDSVTTGQDVVLFIISRLRVVYQERDTIESVAVSLHRVHMFDVRERSIRHGSDANNLCPMPSEGTVMAEGYSIQTSTDDADNQIDVTIDRSPSRMDVSLVVNYLSLTALVKPCEEMSEFFSCSWGAPDHAYCKRKDMREFGQFSDDDHFKAVAVDVNVTGVPRCFGIKLVFHYPRFIFIADESDRHSRALVLEGLATANATISTTFESKIGTNRTSRVQVLEVQGDFQKLTSHIYPDISDMISVRSTHHSLLSILTRPMQELSTRPKTSDFCSAQRVPLLLPLTIGLEYKQKVYEYLPRVRSLCLSIDSLSMMLNTQDISLIHSLLHKWPAKQDKKSAKQSKLYGFEVSFEGVKLGLGLRKNGNAIVVDHVEPVAAEKSIEKGDIVHAINDTVLSDIESVALSDIVDHLASLSRPLTVSFSRHLALPSLRLDAQLDYDASEVFYGSTDQIDLTLSTGSLTFLEDDVTLLRANLRQTEISLQRNMTCGTMYSVKVQSSISLDCYNLRAWTWEPFLEPGIFSITATYQDPRQGSRELSIELGDRNGPICMNLSDAGIESIGKLCWSNMRSDAVDSRSGLRDYSDEAVHRIEAEERIAVHKAANAALQFALRQKYETAKPFVIRNRSGVPVAFALQQNLHNSVADQTLAYINPGDYPGMDAFSKGDVRFLGCDEEIKFFVDVASKDSNTSGRRFPSLTISLQATEEFAVEPVRDLDIGLAEETLVPLFEILASSQNSTSVHQWASWSVEQTLEKTILTFGGSIQLISLIRETIEVGISVHKSLNGSARDEIIAIGKCSAGRPLSLPLWLGLRKCAWSCVCKFDKDPAFTCLFKSSENLRRLNGTYVRFASDASDNKLSRFVSLSVYEVNDAYTISIDCGISFRNLLPTNIEWKIASGLPPEAKMIDNSSLRSFDSIGDQFLPSGERAEIFCNGYDGLYTQIRIYERQSWSTWVSLSLSNNAEPMPQRDSSTEVREANITDALGFSLNVGVRITRKGGGIDVAIFAEVWCSNFTSLPVVFGCPQHEIISAQYSPEELQPTELTAAEAALREISLLFEGGGSETGPPGKNAGLDADVVDIHRIPEQGSPEIVEECFEYNEMEGSRIKRNWWAGENPNAPRKALPYVDSCEDVRWLDESWKVDLSSGVDHGWESSPSLPNFSRLRKYDAQHRFRRRRWYRKRSGCVAVPEGITAFCQPMRRGLVALDGSGRDNGGAFKMAVQVEGGRWALTPLIPSRGAAHGVIRVAKARWPYRLLREDTGEPSQEKIVYELCYSIAPLDDEWGDLSRLMVLTSRFLVRNDSISVVFEMKQAGSSDSSAITIKPGDTVAFHWSDRRLPMLVSVRPVDSVSHAFGWSGGFDPLMIGAVPLRTCRAVLQMDNSKASEEVMSIKVESEIRAKTGGTGISLALKEEDREGHGALFRIENATSFPIWFSQDGLLANGEDASGHASSLGGELIRSSASAVFALDVPFRQGKYAGRKAASMEELVRARVALAPLNSRAGIETTKVVSMIAVGEKVRLNPSRLMLLSSEIRASIRRIRVVGIVLNDGPTRVLRFGLMVKPDSDTIFSYPFVNEMFISISCQGDTQTAVYSREMEDGAYFANELLKDKSLLGEDDAILKMILDPVTISTSHRNSIELADTIPFRQEMIVSLRAAFRGLIVSLVDSAPSEICVISLENINAIATFDWLRTSGSTMYITVTSLQVDNMVPNAPFPVAIAPLDLLNREASARLPLGCGDTILPTAPLLVIGVSIAPKHSTGVVCFKSITIAPRNLSIHVDLAFLVRLQRYFVEIVSHFREFDVTEDWNRWTLPDIAQKAKELEANVSSAVGRQKFYFEGLTILPCQIKLSVAPARALTHAQALLEGEKAAQIHQAVRKGDVQLGHAGLLGVKVGHRNATPLAVVRGVFKSIVVDALLRLDGANLDFAGVSLRNHTSTSSQLITYIGAHYLASLRQNLPALLGSLAAFGNPLGLVRGLGDGVSDFVLEPMKGFQKSVQQMDATYLVDGVARGTLSLARHTVGGIADSAAMLTETFSKNMTILTLDRRYAQKRDRKEILREQGGANVGIGSGVTKLAQGFVDGVTGVVKAPMRGAEKKGIEGFAKGMGKGLLGLLVKPIIGISDGITDVMIGVKGTVDGGTGPISTQLAQIRPRRAFYGAEHVMRVYNVADAAAAALMMRTRLAGERYLNHLDMVDRVALLSVKRLLLLGSTGEELLVLKYKHIDSMEVRSVEQADGSSGWCIIVVLNTPRRNGSDIEVINCRNQAQANELRTAIEQGIGHDENRVSSQQSTALAIPP